MKKNSRRDGRGLPDAPPTPGVPGATQGTTVLLLLVGLASFMACVPEDGDTRQADGAEAPPSTRVVDSIFPIEEEIRRFREGLPEVTALTGGAPSRHALVERFVEVVESGDLQPLTDLMLTRSEFGYLYYPHTIYTAPPYELPPSLLWFQMENLSSRGLTRLSQRLAGNPLHVTGYTCDEPPLVQEENTIWDECRLSMAPPDAEPYDIRLFGSIVERNGVFKFVSYSSEL